MERPAMRPARPLPKNLVQRYHGWKATTFAENAAWYRRLATEGQRPRAMVISCCDSRVHVTSIFGAEQGEFFIHRNIANLVPPFEPDGRKHGTSAAIEYAVMVLKVKHLGTFYSELPLEEGQEYFIGRDKSSDLVLESSKGISSSFVS